MSTTAPSPAKKSTKKASAKKVAAKKSTKKAAATRAAGASESRRPRRTPLFPASTFEDALELATAIYEVGSGQPVRRITLFDSLGRSPDSGPSRQWITNGAKYGLTTGSYAAEFLGLTPEGLQAVAEDVTGSTRARMRFQARD